MIVNVLLLSLKSTRDMKARCAFRQPHGSRVYTPSKIYSARMLHGWDDPDRSNFKSIEILYLIFVAWGATRVGP